MKLLHDGAGVPEAAVDGWRGGGRERDARKEEREEQAGSSTGYIVKRDEPPFLSGRRAGSVATIVEIYLRPKGARSSSAEEIISTYD